MHRRQCGKMPYLDNWCGRLARRRYPRCAPRADASTGTLSFPWHFGGAHFSGSGTIGHFVGGSFSHIPNRVFWAMEGGGDVHGHDLPDFEILPMSCTHRQVFVEHHMGGAQMSASCSSGRSKLGLSRAPSSVNSHGFAGQRGLGRVPWGYECPIWIDTCYV